MDRQRHTPARAPSRTLNTLAGLALLLVSTGLISCTGRPAIRTREGVQGQTGVVANYQGRQLRADLPCWVQVPSAAAAAERVLSKRGLSISHREVDAGSALILGTPPGGNPDPLFLRERTRVNITTEQGCVKVRILVEPVGSEPVSRTILEQMLFELGL